MIKNQLFWKWFWRSTRKSYGALVAIFSMPVTLLLWYFPTTTRVPLGIVIVVGTLAIAILLSLSHMAYSAIQEVSGRLPRVMHSRKGTGGFKDVVAVCLLEESTLFSHGMAVSFYFKDSAEFEVLIGTGIVINVQDDRRIQVGLRRVAKGQEDAVDELQSNNADALRRLIVKPYVQASPINFREFGGFDD